MDENSTAKQESIINNAITTEFETVDTLDFLQNYDINHIF